MERDRPGAECASRIIKGPNERLARRISSGGGRHCVDLNIGLHGAVHVVIWRATGEGIGEVTDQEDRVITTLSPARSLGEWDVIALMAPEVYMTMHGIPFTDNSVSDDRRVVDLILHDKPDADAIKAKAAEELKFVLSCPYIERAIGILAPELDDIETIGSVSGEVIYELIDLILMASQYAVGLRELLKEQRDDKAAGTSE